MIKNENIVISELIEIIKEGLKTFDIKDCDVIQIRQSPKSSTGKKPIVMISTITNPRIGWQGRSTKFDKENNLMIRTEKYLQEFSFQISCYKRRNPKSETEDTSSDILNKLISYFSSKEGQEEIRKKEYNTFRISSLSQPYFINDSDQFEKNPSFDMSLIANQSYQKNIPFTNEFKGKLRGV